MVLKNYTFEIIIAESYNAENKEDAIKELRSQYPDAEIINILV